MQKFFLISGCISGTLAVMIGAFGAHALKDILASNQRTDTFELAVKYQFYHTFALLMVGILLFYTPHKLLHYAGYSFLAGILIFSGSLYILALTGITRWGAVTPFGGLALIAGWVLLGLGIYLGNQQG